MPHFLVSLVGVSGSLSQDFQVKLRLFSFLTNDGSKQQKMRVWKRDETNGTC